MVDGIGRALRLQAEIAKKNSELKEILEQLRGTVGKDWPADRVETVGELAHLHLELIEAKGSITRNESLDLRRHYFGNDARKVRASANLFGQKDSGAILYRDRSYGSRVKGSDPIKLTKEGERLAAEYRRRRGLSSVQRAS